MGKNDYLFVEGIIYLFILTGCRVFFFFLEYWLKNRLATLGLWLSLCTLPFVLGKPNPDF